MTKELTKEQRHKLTELLQMLQEPDDDYYLIVDRNLKIEHLKKRSKGLK
jgi:hypothetical protein